MSKITILNKYGTIPNSIINNPKMSLKAKGLWVYIQSKPDDWDFSADRIKYDTKESKDAILSGLKELENFGYLLRVKTQNDKGFWEIEYYLYEKPTKEEPKQENPEQEKAYINKKGNTNKEINKKEIIISSKKKFGEFEIKAAEYFIEKQKENGIDTFNYLIEKNGLEDFILKNASAVDKLKKLDKLTEDEIRVIIEFAVTDSFRQKQVRTLKYLRKTNDDKIPYRVIFLAKAKEIYLKNKQYEIDTI